MAVLKLSAIAAAGGAPGAGDQAVGVTAGATDNLFTFTQVATTVFNTVGLTIGSAKINSGSSGRLLYDNSAVVGEATVAGSLTFSGGILSVTAGGIASPTTSVQFNNGGQFGGDSGFTYAGTGQATLALGTITANEKALNITGTWNASGVTFDAPLFMNITNTASAASSLLADLQVGSSSQFSVDKNGVVTVGSGILSATFNASVAGVSGAMVVVDIGRYLNTTAGGFITLSGTFGVNSSFNQNTIPGDGLLGFKSASHPITVGNPDVAFFRDAAVGIIAIGDAASNTTATGLRVYNTTDNVATNTAPTNYERIELSWTDTANVATFGPQAGGTGTLRYLQHTTALAAAAPATKTSAYSQALTDQWIIFNSASSITLTLLSAATYPGLSLIVSTINTGTVISASSNVIPRAGGSAGTAILSATAGSWALLVSNGTNWQLMAGTP